VFTYGLCYVKCGNKTVRLYNWSFFNAHAYAFSGWGVSALGSSHVLKWDQSSNAREVFVSVVVTFVM